MKNLFFLFLLMLVPNLATSTSIVVTNTAPAGPGSLLDAVNTAVTGDVICFDPATNGIPIIPSTTLNVGQDITIRGNGCGITIISGGSAQQIMRISGASLAPGSVVIEELTMRRGNSAINGGAIEAFGAGLTTIRACFESNVAQGTTINEGGGAIYIIDGNLESIQSRFTGNATINNFSTGGGIHFASGLLLSVDQSDFQQNRASVGGGAIFNESALTTNITNSNFQANGAGPFTSFGFGGAIYSNNPALSLVNNCQFINNNAFAAGGAIFTATGEMRLQTCTLNDNQTNGGTGNNGGGAVTNVNGTVVVELNSEIRDNNAFTGFGGGILNFGNGIARVTDSRIINNFADLDGGGIADRSGTGTLDVADSELITNTSGVNGGGIYVQANTQTRVIDSDVSGNRARLSGGGLYIGTTNFAMRNTLVQQNTASTPTFGDGGGGLFTLASPSDVRTCTITGNQATSPGSAGGGINAAPGSVLRVWDNSDVSNNLAGNRGGGIQLNSAGNVMRVELTEIQGNSVSTSSSEGGGINVTDLTEARVRGCVTAFNRALIRGGGINVEGDGILRMNRGSVLNNQANEEGGGICTRTGPTSLRFLSVYDNQVLASTFTGGGGGFYNQGGNVNIRKCSFYQNVVSGAGGGGGFRNWDGPLPIAIYTTFSNNTAAFGGGIQSATVFRGRNITVTENTPSGMDGQGDLRRSIVHDNFGTDFTGVIFSGTNNVLVGPYSALGAGNIFVPSANLLPLGPSLPGHTPSHIPDCGSVAIAAAIGGGGSDQNNQPVFGIRDIGAHEVRPIDPSCPAIANTTDDEVRTMSLATMAESPTVFPNPVNSDAQIRVAIPTNFGASINLTLTDLTGRTLMERKVGNGTIDLDLPAGIATGTYLLQLITEDRQETLRVQVVE